MEEQKVMGDMLTQKHSILDENPYDENTYVESIFRLQKAFASRFIPFDFCQKSAESRRYWTTELAVCIQDELCEVLGWLDWKHWKKYENYKMDVGEIKFELIDTLHFLVNMAHVWGFKPYKGLLSPDATSNMLMTLQGRYKHLMLDMTSSLMDLWRTPRDESTILLEEAFHSLRQMFGLFRMTEEEVYRYYTSKNQENYERQERGY